ncbi:molybdenum cofactor guanylyltransferase [Pullulanibacillus sp. KACC 23026]|uniref:molybdenum cofactor guanylyltransferase n=1 Tax=Pullulanibacillus sp. KACC 23026 TaxID=3028315 RepID=UPI0023B0EFAF|nr:molybdenum cofactor guanylyltransferase [Pullulanibacillus sp. KACC 23026]WEG14272.1 molybdenum cofactor guanylyltransferase [Pullulanibacillus sp. KACC 23026]
MRIGVILSGGTSSRFGRPKAFVCYKDRYFYDYAKEQLKPYVEEIVVVSHPDLVERFSQDPEIKVIQDVQAFQGKGPLAGLYSAFQAFPSDAYLVLPCDAPFVQADFMQWLIEEAEQHSESNGIVPIAEGRLHPLMGLYKRKCLAVLKSLLQANQLKVSGLIEQANVAAVQVSPSLNPISFNNINTKEDLEKIQSN